MASKRRSNAYQLEIDLEEPATAEDWATISEAAHALGLKVKRRGPSRFDVVGPSEFELRRFAEYLFS